MLRLLNFHITKYGDSAVVVNFEESISQEVNSQVHVLNDVLCNLIDTGILYTIPAYTSLTVGFDKGKTTHASVSAKIQNCIPDLESIPAKEGRVITLPICYHESFAIDSERMKTHTGLTMAQIATAHYSEPYHVFMLGFVAGFAYMGSVPNSIQCPRLQTPRKSVLAGSVGIAGPQTGIYPIEAPGGWNIIGRCPISLITMNDAHPFVLRAGDEVRFEPIDLDTFHSLIASTDLNSFDRGTPYE